MERIEMNFGFNNVNGNANKNELAGK